MSCPIISAEQRDALYRQITKRLNDFGNLFMARMEKDFEATEKLAREFADDLQFVTTDLGWQENGTGPVELTTPPDALKRLLRTLRGQADENYESGRSEQESLQAALVRETCDELLRELPD